MDGSVRMGFYLFSKSLHALEAKGFRQGLYSVGTFTMGDKMENQESGKVTGCKLCLENYEVGSKHYCSVNGLQAALRESRNYVGTLESQLSSLRQSAKGLEEALESECEQHWIMNEQCACKLCDTLSTYRRKEALNRYSSENKTGGVK